MLMDPLLRESSRIPWEVNWVPGRNSPTNCRENDFSVSGLDSEHAIRGHGLADWGENAVTDCSIIISTNENVTRKLIFE